MNHAVFCVTPKDRANSHDEMPFFAFVRSQVAGSHFDSGKGDSSYTVPVFALNCFRHPEQFQIRRLATNPTFAHLHRGQ